MKIALWGAGMGLYEAMDRIDNGLHSIECIIDSNREISGQIRNGILIKHYENVRC